MTSARIIADSECSTRITTFEVTCQRYILAEINTHKMIVKNSASSRAIPVHKRIQQVRNNPAGPSWWGANQAGMQSSVGLSGSALEQAQETWSLASGTAAAFAQDMAKAEVHKQFANRIVEPYVWHTCLLTGTEWGNFFNLRVSEHAAPEFDLLAGMMLREYVQSEPRELKPGEWHAPFADRIPEDAIPEGEDWWKTVLAVSAARCARLSYETQDGEFSISKDLELARRLLESGHMSPFEHQAQAVDSGGDLGVPHREVLQTENALYDGWDIWWGPFRGWRQFRKMLPGENQTELNAEKLLAAWEQRWEERGRV